MKLRPYQEQAVNAVLADWSAGLTDVLGVAATGAGKTQMFLEILRRVLTGTTKRALIIAHRAELIDQPVERTRGWEGWDIGIGVVMADRDDASQQITVATIQTLSSQKRLANFLKYGQIDYLVIDEAHHGNASTYLALIETLRGVNPDLKHLGVTATPMRADGDGLARIYQKCSFRITIADLVKQHYLVQPRWLGIATGIDLKGVESRAGDYVQKQLAARFDTPQGRDIILWAYQEYGAGRRAIAFTASVEGAHALAGAFLDVGISAAGIDGTTDKEERKRIIARYKAGEIQVLTNCQVLTEGFDAPGTACILMCRPTKSDSLYIQCLDMQTEVLTHAGWRCYETLDAADYVAGFDRESSGVQWVPIQRIIKRPLAPDEQMYAIQSPTVDLRVTGGHRMLMRHRRSPDPEWRFVNAEDLAQKRSEYQIPVAGFQNASGVPLSPDELRFVGLWLSDGTINQKTRQVAIIQAAHQPQNADIIAILDGCGFSYNVWEHDRQTQYNATSPVRHYTIRRGRNKTDALAHIDLYLDKNFAPAMERVTSVQLGYVLEGLHIGDGIKERNVTWTRRTYHIVTGNLVFAERLQSLCVRRGYRCNIATRATPTGEAYTLHIKWEDRRYIGGIGQDDRPTLQPTDALPDEQVWCLSNELETLIIRRNGKVAIIGNCMGRGLRPAAGMAAQGEDCLILDFMPEDTRNIVLAGDVLGLPRETTRAVLKDATEEEPGAVQAGFTFDGETFDASGTPMEIIARQLDYLSASPYVWERRGGWLTLGLGTGADGLDRILVITPPEGGADAALWGIWREPAGYTPDGKPQWGAWRKGRIASGDMDMLGELGNEKAAKWGAAILTSKGRSWHREPASEGQVKYLRRLMPPDERKALRGEQLTKQVAAALITHYQARTVLVQ